MRRGGSPEPSHPGFQVSGFWFLVSCFMFHVSCFMFMFHVHVSCCTLYLACDLCRNGKYFGVHGTLANSGTTVPRLEYQNPNPGGGLEGGQLKTYRKSNVSVMLLWEAAFTPHSHHSCSSCIHLPRGGARNRRSLNNYNMTTDEKS